MCPDQAARGAGTLPAPEAAPALLVSVLAESLEAIAGLGAGTSRPIAYRPTERPVAPLLGDIARACLAALGDEPVAATVTPARTGARAPRPEPAPTPAALPTDGWGQSGPAPVGADSPATPSEPARAGTLGRGGWMRISVAPLPDRASAEAYGALLAELPGLHEITLEHYRDRQAEYLARARSAGAIAERVLARPDLAATSLRFTGEILLIALENPVTPSGAQPNGPAAPPRPASSQPPANGKPDDSARGERRRDQSRPAPGPGPERQPDQPPAAPPAGSSLPPSPVTTNRSGGLGFFELGTDLFFNARHYVVMNGRKGQTHPHSWRVRVTFKERTLDSSGMIAGFADVKRIVQREISRFDNVLLNGVTPFEGNESLQPTTENLAAVLYRNIDAALRAGGMEMGSVCLWETPTNYVLYSERPV